MTSSVRTLPPAIQRLSSTAPVVSSRGSRPSGDGAHPRSSPRARCQQERGSDPLHPRRGVSGRALHGAPESASFDCLVVPRLLTMKFSKSVFTSLKKEHPTFVRRLGLWIATATLATPRKIA